MPCGETKAVSFRSEGVALACVVAAPRGSVWCGGVMWERGCASGTASMVLSRCPLVLPAHLVQRDGQEALRAFHLADDAHHAAGHQVDHLLGAQRAQRACQAQHGRTRSQQGRDSGDEARGGRQAGQGRTGPGGGKQQDGMQRAQQQQLPGAGGKSGGQFGKGGRDAHIKQGGQCGRKAWEEGVGGKRGPTLMPSSVAYSRKLPDSSKTALDLGASGGGKRGEESAGGGTRGDAQRREAAVRDGGGMRQGVGAGVPVHAHPHPHPHPQPWTCAAFVAGVRGQVAAAWKLGGGPHLDLPPAPSPPPPAARSRWDPGGTTLRYMRQYTWPHKWRYETAAHPHTAAGSHPKAAHTSLSIHTHTHTHKMPLYTRSHKAPRRPT